MGVYEGVGFGVTFPRFSAFMQVYGFVCFWAY